ncbi:MAG: acylphosphatase [Xanthobacteraceae bacterium]|nr:acylphosphatase [Xanthobacteraceae bacterium]
MTAKSSAHHIIIRLITVRGRVQGVGYRAFVVAAARTHGIEGWVRNRRDGSVEAVIAGSLSAVSVMITECRRGPPAARVEALDEQPAAATTLGLRPPGEVFAALATV